MSTCYLNFPEQFTTNDDENLSFTTYMQRIIDNHQDYVKIVRNVPVKFEYPAIKADIAV